MADRKEVSFEYLKRVVAARLPQQAYNRYLLSGAGDALQDHRALCQPLSLQPHQAARPVRRVRRPLRDARLQAQALQGQDQVEEEELFNELTVFYKFEIE